MKLEEIQNKTKDGVEYLVQSLESGQKPTATNVEGGRTWNSLGRFVKRREKGIMILSR